MFIGKQFTPFHSVVSQRRALEMRTAEQNNGIGKYFSSQQLFSWLINRVCAPIYSQPIQARSECEYHFRVSYSSNRWSRPIRPKWKTKRTYFRAFPIPKHRGFFFFWFLRSTSKQRPAWIVHHKWYSSSPHRLALTRSLQRSVLSICLTVITFRGQMKKNKFHSTENKQKTRV